MEKPENCERDFSIELASSGNLTRFATNGGVLIEGTLGRLLRVFFVEPEILEVKGDSGVLRLNLRKSEISSSIILSPNSEVKEVHA